MDFLDGKIEIQIQNPSLAHGQTLNGTVQLDLNKDINSDSLDVTLYSEIVMDIHTNAGQILHSETQNLDKKKLYTKANRSYQYHFTFTIPPPDTVPASVRMVSPEELKKLTPEQIAEMDKIAGFAEKLNPERWFVMAQLKYNNSSDSISKTQEIYVLKA